MSAATVLRVSEGLAEVSRALPGCFANVADSVLLYWDTKSSIAALIPGQNTGVLARVLHFSVPE